ncbi:LrgA [Rhodanobacter ginsengisoli]|uniref:LrgA n=1 Tax=Rhodanobacter ginsengisoli TaxID=418646 RepID=A0ABW0QNU5_9GAMM
MNPAAPTPGSWSKVERVASLCLISSLLAFIGSRLIFAVWWPMHPVDFILSSLAVALLTASFWFAAHRRNWRIAVIACASATQLLPMLLREPILLLPILGGLIPVTILFASLLALSKKDRNIRPPQRS